MIPHQALYRKHRPRRFADIIGQGHIPRVLARDAREGRASHAYLFAGPRGTGKTSTARILAKAINCEGLEEAGEPCDECPSCQDITSGRSIDVRELDAASHNSVENIRDIRTQVTMVASTPTSHRVFILDEAHMLSVAACNALLKTLEEPPPDVHFILATTEPFKLLETIRSRSQRFDFHPVAMETLVLHLRRISEQEGYQTDEGGLGLIARHARGSVRDSLNLLEQVAAGGRQVDADAVERALGVAGPQVFASLSRVIADRDARRALTLVAELEKRGVNLRSFVSDAIGFFRGAYLASHMSDPGSASDEPPEVVGMWRETSESLTAVEISRTISHLGEALMGMRGGRDGRVVTEMALMKVVRPELSAQPADLNRRIEALEARIGREPTSGPPPAEQREESAGGAHPPKAADPPPEGSPTGKRKSAPSPPPTPDPQTPPGPPRKLHLDRLRELWSDVVRGFSGMEAALLRQTAPVRLDGGILYVDCEVRFRMERLAEKKSEGRLTERIMKITGEGPEVRFVAEEGEGGRAASPRPPNRQPENTRGSPSEDRSGRNGKSAPTGHPDLDSDVAAFMEAAGVTVSSVRISG